MYNKFWDILGRHYSTHQLTDLLFNAGINPISGFDKVIPRYFMFQSGLDDPIIIPKNITGIARFAFSRSKLEEIKLPDTLTDVDTNCFSGLTYPLTINYDGTLRSFHKLFHDFPIYFHGTKFTANCKDGIIEKDLR